jgi:hypothetical protein
VQIRTCCGTAQPGLDPVRGVGKEIECLPRALIVEEPICPLLVVFSNRLWLLMPLKPCLILLVESPALRLQRLGRGMLLKGALLVIEGIEERVCFDPGIETRIIKNS